jgi:hypothetical protein
MLVISALSGCRGAEPAAEPQKPPEPVVVRPGVRLAWDQPILDGTTTDAYRFLLLVDGARTPLDAAECGGRPGPDGALCTAPMPPLPPGRHDLAIVARTGAASGRESRPSAILVVVAR